MRKILLISCFVLNCYLILFGQAIYVDCNVGDDNYSGTKEAPVHSIQKAVDIIQSKDNDVFIIKINPGIYILDNPISIATEKDINDKRIIIEASILPDDNLWTPEKMPVITSRAAKGEIEYYHWVVSLLVDESHVTIRGIKFTGYFYPQTRYFPIARIDKTKTDLLVEQCLFVGDANTSQIQAGVIAHGNEVIIDHCVFYKLRNTVVFFQSSNDDLKHGNGITNTIIYGADQAIWTVGPEIGFKFENNIISDCRYVWVNSKDNATIYSINNCIIVNNKYFQGIPDTIRLKPGKFDIKENNIIKEGEVSLRLMDRDDKPLLNSVDKPLPIDYMHIIPETLGHDMGAGLFKK